MKDQEEKVHTAVVIVNNEAIKKEIATHGLIETKAAEIAAMFVPMTEMLVAVEDQYNELVSRPYNPELAGEYHRMQLDIGQVRLKGDKERIKMKAAPLSECRAIDGAYKLLLFSVAAKESNLKELRKRHETEEKARIEALRESRTKELMLHNVADIPPALGEMTPASWDMQLLGAKTADENRKAEAETARKEKEENDRLDKLAQEKIRLDNERLQKEAKEKEEKEAKEKEEREAKEAAAQLRREAAAKKLADETAAKLKIEQDKAKKLQDEANARAKEKAEQEAKEAEELEARLKLGDKGKFDLCIDNLNKAIMLPDLESKAGQKKAKGVNDLLAKIIDYINK